MVMGSTVIKVLAGVALGAFGGPLLKTKTSRKVATQLTAGAMIAKDYVLEQAEVAQSMAMDIADDAKVIVEKYYATKDEEFEAQVNGMDTDSKHEIIDADVVED